MQVSNTALSVSPLPGGPGIWDISVDESVVALIFHLRSNLNIELAAGKSSVQGVANRSSLDAATVGIGGHALLTSTAYGQVYCKSGGALYLSSKIFSDTGDMIALTDAYLTLTGPSTRVFRTTWTNFDAIYRTLNVWGELTLLS